MCRSVERFRRSVGPAPNLGLIMARVTGSIAARKAKRGSSSSRVGPSGRKLRTSTRPKSTGPIIKDEDPASVPYEAGLYVRLQDREYARGYLAECLRDEHPGTFFVGLRHVIQARRAMAPMARRLHLNRPALYKALSANGNPSLKTIRAVLEELDFKLDLAE